MSTHWPDRFQILFLLPVLRTPAVSGTIYRVFVWDHDTGLANWLVDQQLALLAVILTAVWVHPPLAMLVLYSTIKGTPRVFCAVGMIDGAGNWRQFWHVTLPLFRQQVVFVELLQTTLSFRQLKIIFLTTGGGPSGATRVLPPALPCIGAAPVTSVFSWNQFFIPLILGGRDARLTATEIARYSGAEHAVAQWGALAALSVVIVLPAIVFGFALNRYLIRGLLGRGGG